MKPSSNSEPKSSLQTSENNAQLLSGSSVTINTNHSQSTLNIRQTSAPLPQHNLSPIPLSIHNINTNPFNFSAASPNIMQQQSPNPLNNSLSCSDLSHFKSSNSFVGGVAGSSVNSANQQYSNIQHTSHFHLAGFIDPEAGIPLNLIKTAAGLSTLPTKQSSENSCNSQSQSQFVVHWMNNKEFHFTYLAELFSKEIYEKIVKIQQGKEPVSTKNNASSSTENMSKEQDDFDNSKENSDDDVNFETRSDVVVIKNKSDNSCDVFENINLDEETKGLLFGNSIDQKVIYNLKTKDASGYKAFL